MHTLLRICLNYSRVGRGVKYEAFDELGAEFSWLAYEAAEQRKH